MSKKDVKEVLLETTKTLIKEHGYVTIKDITTHSYMNVAAVNYHFGSKDRLIEAVIIDVLDELKVLISDRLLKTTKDENMTLLLADMLNVLYNFVAENAGILKYLFLSIDNQLMSANELFYRFFEDETFTELVYKNLSHAIQSENPHELRARYMIIFSGAILPMLFSLLQIDEKVMEPYNNPEFRAAYIAQLLRVVTA